MAKGFSLKGFQVKKPALQKPQLTTRSRNGLFSTGLICIVIAIVLIFNIAIGQLPEKYRQFDISTTQIYTMSQTTLDYMDQLADDVDITVVATKDSTDDRIVRFLDRYAALSDHLKLEWIDPVVHPSALTDYDCTADTVIVSAGDKTTQVPFTSILVSDDYYAYYYGTNYYTEFDGEGQLTSAIDYVLSDTTYKLYYTNNHGESGPGSSLSDLLTKNHFEASELSLMMDGIPEDCDVLFIGCPTSDFSQSEIEQLEEYLSQGGKISLIWGAESFEHPNLDAFMEEYGLKLVSSGYVGDTTRYYQSAQTYFAFFPELDSSSEAANGTNSNDLCLIYGSFGMEQVDAARDTIEVDPFLKTSENGIASVGADYEQGTYIIGATATETIDEDEGTQAQLTVFSSASLIDDSITSEFGSSIINLTVYMNTLTADFEDISTISIDAKSLEVTYNTVTNAGAWSLLYLIALPAVFLIWGFMRWYHRRKL